MSFSSDIKEDLSNVINYKNKKILEAEAFGFLLTGNTVLNEEYIEYSTENEFIIEKLYKILFNLQIDYEPDVIGKEYVARIKRGEALNSIIKFNINLNEQEEKALVRGSFLGAGSLIDPSKHYHLEVLFLEKNNAEFIMNICRKYDIDFKMIEARKKYQIYLKDAENISKFLALIESNKGVLAFEYTRLTKEIKNNVNRLVNCETANLNKVVNAAVNQINDIKLIQRLKKFDELSEELKEIAMLRLENPDMSLKDLGQLLEKPLGKSGVNHRFQKIHDIAEEYRR